MHDNHYNRKKRVFNSFLIIPPLFLDSLTSLISACLNLLFGIQDGLGSWSLFPANKKQGIKWLVPGKAPQGLAESNTPFPLIFLNLEENRYRTKKELSVLLLDQAL